MLLAYTVEWMRRQPLLSKASITTWLPDLEPAPASRQSVDQMKAALEILSQQTGFPLKRPA